MRGQPEQRLRRGSLLHNATVQFPVMSEVVRAVPRAYQALDVVLLASAFN